MPSELDFHMALARPGTLIDVGANKGVFTVWFATVAGAKIESFEPVAETFALLDKEIRSRNQGEIPAHIRLHKVALSNFSGTTEIQIPGNEHDLSLACATIAQDLKAKFAQDSRVRISTQMVAVRPLDLYQFKDVISIKIDAEGNEQAVVEGGLETIGRCKPFISMELEERHIPGCLKAVPEMMTRLGYECYFSHANAVFPFSSLNPATMANYTDKASDPYIYEYFFLPIADAARKEAFINAAPRGLRHTVD